MTSATVRRPFIVGAIALLCAGCGGGAERVSKDDFIAESDAICFRANEKVGGRPKLGDVFDVNQPDSYRRVLRYYRNFVETERAALNGLRALEVPTGDQKPVSSFLSAFETMIAYADQSLTALRASDLEDFRNSKKIRALYALAAQVEIRAGAYGFEDCTQLGIR